MLNMGEEDLNTSQGKGGNYKKSYYLGMTKYEKKMVYRRFLFLFLALNKIFQFYDEKRVAASKLT